HPPNHQSLSRRPRGPQKRRRRYAAGLGRSHRCRTGFQPVGPPPRLKPTMSNRDSPPGFQGLLSDKPVTVYHRHLPHWRQDGATYFVTFRQHDSLPQEKLDQLEFLRREWFARITACGIGTDPNPTEIWDQVTREVAQRMEQ